MPPAVLSDIKIVILEDHPDTRSFSAKFLNQHGAKVVATPDAFDGPQAVKQFRPDMLLSDIYPPNRDGFEVLRDIRELRPENGGSEHYARKLEVVAWTVRWLLGERCLSFSISRHSLCHPDSVSPLWPDENSCKQSRFSSI